jgi:5-methylcytosine-specific restriction enzyme A
MRGDMTRGTPHLCGAPYCPNIVDGPGRCPQHRASGWQSWAGADPGAYDRAWRKVRDAYIQAHPACERCGAPAVEVHHLNHQPRDNREANLMSVCLDCHRRLTGRRGRRSHE